MIQKAPYLLPSGGSQHRMTCPPQGVYGVAGVNKSTALWVTKKYSTGDSMMIRSDYVTGLWIYYTRLLIIILDKITTFFKNLL